jgi:integrase
MAVIKLDANTLAILKCPAGKRSAEFCDTDVKGLYLLVSQTGMQTFFWRTKVDGRTVHTRIGNTSEISLANARAEVTRLKAEQSALAHQSATSPELKKKEDMTLGDLWVEYYDFAQTTVPRSVKRLEQLWRIRIEPRFGHMKLNEISLREVQSFMMDLRKEGLSAATADYHAALLRRLGNMAVMWGYLDTNFTKGIQLYHEFNGVENVLNDAQLQKLLSVLHTDSNRPICLLALLLLSSGMRLNEAVSAQWKNVSIENRIWTVPRELSKSKRQRNVVLSDSALEIIQQIDRKESDVYVFTNRKTNKPFVNVFKPWNRLRIKAGVPFLRLHDLRHMYATYCVNNGRSIFEVSQLLGHADTRTTIRYSHLSAKTLLEAANSVTTKMTDVMRVKPDSAVFAEAGR